MLVEMWCFEPGSAISDKRRRRDVCMVWFKVNGSAHYCHLIKSVKAVIQPLNVAGSSSSGSYFFHYRPNINCKHSSSSTQLYIILNLKEINVWYLTALLFARFKEKDTQVMNTQKIQPGWDNRLLITDKCTLTFHIRIHIIRTVITIQTALCG